MALALIAAIPALLMWLTLRAPRKPLEVWDEKKIQRAYAAGLFRARARK